MALSIYALPATLALGANGLGLPWLAVALAWLHLTAVTLAVLAFSVPPLPTHPRTLAEMDFAAIAWLPHAAVTRLPEEGIRHRARRRIAQRLGWAFCVLVGANALVALDLVRRLGLGRLPTVGVALAVALGFVVWLALVGRERLLARGVPPAGTDIG